MQISFSVCYRDSHTNPYGGTHSTSAQCSGEQLYISIHGRVDVRTVTAEAGLPVVAVEPSAKSLLDFN